VGLVGTVDLVSELPDPPYLPHPPYPRYRSLRALKPCATLIIFFILTGHPVAQQPAAALVRLQHDIDALVAAPAFERGSVAIVVRSLATDETVYTLNAPRLMMPASTLKIVTLAAAGERLGWDHAYETRIVADGPVDGGTLEGNLVIVGSGDPSLDRPAIDSWAAQIKMLGVTKVTGRVLADARAFSGEGIGFGWSWDDLAYYYAAPIAAVQFRENAVDITVRPGPSPDAPVSYELMSPEITGLRIENRMSTGARTAALEFVARRAANSPTVVLEGVLPVGSPPVVRTLSVHDPVRYLAAAFTEALLAAGVALGGPPPLDASADAARDYSRETPMVTHRSAPLRVLAQRLMEVSQNQYAETLIKTIGAQAGAPTFEGGLKAIESVLASWGIAADAAILRDGSGLSRYDYVTAELLVQVMTRMYRDPAQRAPFLATLNVAGQSGTLATRMKNTPAVGNVRAKDGSMAGVRALSGLVNTAGDEPLAFAILVNNFAAPGPTVTAAIDAIVVRLAGFRR
jgi:D-alanyl-D-alanine carboxypeptidase/D-alanyl-D-alanine-endopeptidase (penicillin-binding protein 4)